MDAKQLLKEYLQSGKTHMIQVASVQDKKPWICTMYFAVDDELNLYWASKESRRHSQELEANPHAAIAIAHNQQPPTSTHQGVQAEGTVEKLSGEEKLAALDRYATQLKSDPDWIKAIKEGRDPHQVYKFTPSMYVLFDDVNFPENPRQEIRLP